MEIEKARFTMDIEQARFNMVEQQIRTWEVLDQSVLELLFQVKRENFVPAAYRSLAFIDMEIPLGPNAGEGQVMMSPKLEARIVQEVAPKAHERVLEVGTGSGYLAALLAKKAERVRTIEISEKLALTASANLAANQITNVEVKVGDAAQSPAAFVTPNEVFEVIVLSGSVPMLPEAFLPHLAVGGRMFAIVGDEPAMKATLMTKTGATSYASQVLFETVLPPLIHAAEPSRFRF
jgi:protein-L-isoaspartate(D-aspartate) O-methyltransferase